MRVLGLKLTKGGSENNIITTSWVDQKAQRGGNTKLKSQLSIILSSRYYSRLCTCNDEENDSGSNTAPREVPFDQKRKQMVAMKEYLARPTMPRRAASKGDKIGGDDSTSIAEENVDGVEWVKVALRKNGRVKRSNSTNGKNCNMLRYY